MSAYDKLGLAMIPSGYKGEADENNAGGFLGKVYSVLPAQTTDDAFLSSSTLNGLTLTQNTDVTYPLYAVGTTGKIRIDFNQTLTSGTRVRYFLRNGANTATITTFSTSVENTNANGSGDFYFEGNMTDGLQIRIIVENGVAGTLNTFTSVNTINGDFDFSRGSDATRVNSQGYIESVQVLSDELVQNGDFEEIGDELITNGGFDTDSNWSNTSGGEYNISNGKLNLTNASYGTNSAQTNVTAIGKIYRVSYEVSNYEKGNVRFFAGGGAGSIQTSNGTYVEFVEASANTSVGFQALDGGGTTLSIDNVSVKEVGQNWTFGTNATIKEENDNLKFSLPTASFGTLLYQDGTTSSTVGFKGRITFTISNYQQGTVTPALHNDSAGSFDSDGTFSIDITKTSTLNRVQFGFSNFIGDIDNISVKEITDDTDIPRLDYSDGCPTLLLEPQRENELIYSEDLDSWDTKVSVSVSDGVTSPDGSSLSDKIYVNTDSSISEYRIRNNFTYQTETDYSYSVFAKKGELNFLRLRTFSAGGLLEQVYFDLENGLVGTTGSSVNEAKMQDFGNGWYRCYMTITTPATISNNLIDIAPAVSDNTQGGSSQNGNGIYVWGAQLEEGSYPTSYIPTNGSTVTRLADVCNNAGDSTIFNDAEGVLYVDAMVSGDDGNFYSFISINDSSTDDDFVAIGYRPNNNTLFIAVRAADNTVFANQSISFNFNEYYKIALKYKSGDSAIWINGVEVDTDTSTFTMSNLKELEFNYHTTSQYDFYGKVRSLLYFNEALTDAELEKLTSSTATQVLNNYSTLLTRVGATYESSGLETKLNELL